MSRSYRKTPVIKDHSRGMKKLANRIFRRKSIVVANGNSYRKLFCSYNISDWTFRETYAEYCARAERYRKEFDQGIGYRRHIDNSTDMTYWNWFKMYRRK